MYCASPHLSKDGVIAAEREDNSIRRWDLTGRELGRIQTTQYLRIASLVFRRRLLDAAEDEGRERACEAIDALALAEEYLDANVNIPLVFQQLAVTLQRQFTPTRG